LFIINKFLKTSKVFFFWSKFSSGNGKNLETFHLIKDLLQDYDYDVIDDLKMGFVEDSRPMVGSISTPCSSYTFERIASPSNLDMGVLVPKKGTL